MDNASIHTAEQINKLITERGYKCVYIPPYSSEFNSIGQFWSMIKNKVKRSTFGDNDTLFTWITEACNTVPPYHLRAFIQHPINMFEKCLNGEPI